MKSKQVQNPEHVEVSQEQTSYRPSSSSNSLPRAHQGREIFFPPSLQRDTITINQEKRMSGFDSFALPDQLGKIVEK